MIDIKKALEKQVELLSKCAEHNNDDAEALAIITNSLISLSDTLKRFRFLPDLITAIVTNEPERVADGVATPPKNYPFD